MTDRDNIQRSIREFLDSERSVYFQRKRSAIEPLQAERKGWYDHAVGYGQMSLRSLFILNGGALIAVPAFAAMLGDGLWARGVEWPFYGFLAFAFGLVLCATATFCAFFAMTRYGHRTGETIERAGAVLESDFIAGLGSNPPADETPRTTKTEKEKRFGKIGALWETAAIILATLSFIAFIAGAVIGGYMISGAPPTDPTQAPDGSLTGSTGGIVPPGGPEKNSN